jgi:hypothetical protein
VILRAAVEASEDGQEASAPLDEITDRNEQWLQSYIAIRLNDEMRSLFASPDGIFVTHEARVSWMNEVTHTCAKPGRPPLTSAQRFDLAVWDREHVVGLIEAKNAPGMDQGRFTQDVRRLVKALDLWGADTGGSLRWTAHVFSVRLTRAAARRGLPNGLEAIYAARMKLLEYECFGCEITKGFLRSNDNDDCLLGWGAIVLTRRRIRD